MPGVSAMDPNVTDFRPRGNSSGSGGGVSVNKIASLFQPKTNGPSQQQPEIDRSRSQSRGEALERSSSTDVRSGYDNKAKFSNARQLFETLGSKPILSEQIVKSTAIRSPQVVRRRTFTPSPPRNEKFTSPTNGQSDPTTTRLDQSFSPRNRAGPPPVPPKPKSVGGDSPDKRKSPGSASGTLERPKEIPPKPTERRSPPLISGSRSPPQQTQMKEDSPLSEVTRQFHELVNNIERMSSTTVSHTIYSNSAPPTVLSPPINSDTQLAKPVYATVVSPVKSPVTSPVRFIQPYPGSPVKTGFGVPRTTSLSQGLSEVADSPSNNNAEPSTSDSGGDSADSHGFNHIPTAVAAISCRYPRITQVLNTSERSANTTTPSINTGANGNGITSPTGANSKIRPSSLLPTISSATTVVTSSSNVTSALYTSTKPGVVSPTSSDSLSKSSDSLNSQNSGGANSSTKPGKFEPYWRAPDAFYRRYPNETSVPNSADSTVSARNYLLKQQFLAGGSQKNPAADMNGSTSQSTRDQFAAESTGSCSSGQTTTITQSTGLLLTRNVTADSSVEPPLPQNLAAAVRRGRLSGSTETRNNGEMSTTVVEPMTVKEAAVLLSPTTREEVLKTDIKSLPTRHHLPSDVDGKRLSSCSIDADPEAFNTAHSAHRNSIPSITEVNWLPDGQFWWAEIPGLRDESPSTPTQESITKTFKVQFSRSPIKVFSTYSGLEYDRRNDDVDPVAASAEYELERRVEKMDKFQVELLKGNDGLGLSIIGMGVGADAGLEKLGIFVKCITPGGAAAKDGRIQVCDQIIEVDGKSLIGVTQAYAAQVLRSTSGTVRFQVGREKDVEKSEIAALIRQSLEQDRVREEQRRQMEQMYRSPPIEMREEPIGAAESNGGRKTDWLTVDSHVNSHQPHSSVNSTDSVFGPEDETPEALSAHNANINQLMEELKQLDFDYLVSTSLQLESNEESLEEAFNMSHHRPELNGVGLASDPEISRLLTESLQEFPPKVVTNFPSNGTELVSASAPTATHQRVSVSYLEFVLEDTKKDAEKFQNLLGESRDQYVDLETKYSMAKQLIKDYQDREREMVEREEAHLQKLREKDAEYNNIVQRLNSKIFELEKQLVEARIAENAIAANAERLIAPPTSPAQDFIPASKAYQPVKRIDSETQKCETQSIGYIRYEESGWECTDSIATSSRDFGVPQTELLDSHVLKAKADAVKQSEIMSARNPPTKRCDTEVEIFCHHTMAGHSHMESVNEGRPVQIETTATATVNHTPGKCSPSKSSSTSASTPTASPIPSKRLAGPFSILLKTKHRADPIAGAKFMAELDLKANCVNQWTCEDVCKLLHGIGLEKYVPEFSVNKIDGQKLLGMDGGKLKSLGVQNHSERALLKKRIKDIKAAIERERKNVVAAVKEGGATKPSAMEKRMSSLKKK